MIKISYLSDLAPGETAYVSITPSAVDFPRLIELGFVAGTRIECVAKAPLGDPGAYLVRGALIALRREDALAVDVTRACAEPHLRKCARGIEQWV